MKQLTRSFVLASALATAGSAGAAVMDDFVPFIGVDYKQLWVRGNGDYRNAFPKTYPGGTIYVGSKFTDCFGAELGYSFSTRKKHDWTDPDFSSVSIASARVRFTSFHLDINGYIPLDNCWELIGSVGVASMKPKVNFSANTSAAAGLTAAQIDGINSINGKSKAVFRVGVGAQYLVTEMVGIRAMVRWENTHRLTVSGNQNFGNFMTAGFINTTRPFKDAISLAVGLFVRF